MEPRLRPLVEYCRSAQIEAGAMQIEGTWSERLRFWSIDRDHAGSLRAGDPIAGRCSSEGGTMSRRLVRIPARARHVAARDRATGGAV